MDRHDVRFGIKVDSDNGAHVRFRLFAATGGQHLGGCGQLTMTSTEYAAFRRLLEPMLTDRPDSGWRYDPANPQDCSYRDDTAHDHDQCLEQMAAGAERAIQLVRAHVEDNGGYRVFEPHRTGAGFLTYDHTNGDYGYIEASGALSQDFVAESEERLCWEALQRGGEDAVFEHLEHLYRRLSPAPRSEQERTSTRG